MPKCSPPRTNSIYGLTRGSPKFKILKAGANILIKVITNTIFHICYVPHYTKNNEIVFEFLKWISQFDMELHSKQNVKSRKYLRMYSTRSLTQVFPFCVDGKILHNVILYCEVNTFNCWTWFSFPSLSFAKKFWKKETFWRENIWLFSHIQK